MQTRSWSQLEHSDYILAVNTMCYRRTSTKLQTICSDLTEQKFDEL